MNLMLVYDSETTGMPMWKEPSDSPGQPHLAQIAAHLVDVNSREVLQSMDVIIRPDEWDIPQEVAEIHGITHEHAMDVGVSERKAVGMLIDLWAQRQRLAHNEQFDARIVRIALKRYFGDEVADAWKAGPATCTARLSTPIVDLPPTDKMKAAARNHAKTPTLGEAYKHFMGRDLENAHRAIVDVNACLDIYWAIQSTTTGE